MPTERTSDSALTRRSALTALGLTGVGIAGLSVLSACTDDNPQWSGSGSGPSGAAKPGETPPKATVTISGPAADAKNVPASTEIVFTATEAGTTTVELTDDAGKTVAGEMHPDGAGWLPAKALAYGATYTAKVTATGDDGKPAVATTTFTTMAKPGKVVSIYSFLADNAVIGVAMPLIFDLSRSIPRSQRAAVQRNLLVTVEPFQEGIWTWYTDRQLHWRPKEFWKAGSKISVNVRAGGLPLGNGYYGKRDSTLICTVGRALIMSVDDRTKQMTVTKDGRVIKKIPVSLGRPTMPSSSGTMVIIERLEKTVFDTMDSPDPDNRYRTKIDFAQRLTWKGEFIHAAPWSVQDQGHRNVSHGCINMSQANAQWLFGQTKIGDPVITKGTPRALEYGNGWTDWSKPWAEYVKGSAIPYVPPAPPASPADPTPAPDASATLSPAPST